MDKTNKGFIKLDRNIERWRWWKNHNTFHVFLTILLLANYKDGNFEKTVIHRGQLATSHGTLSGLTGLTISQVRTALSNLVSTGEIAITRKSKYLLITIPNYNKYQDDRRQNTIISQSNDNQIALKSQQSKNSTINSTKERKKGKKESLRSDSPLTGKADDEYDSPVGIVKRGTDAFRNVSHLILNAEEGTADDIPVRYRELCNNNFATYLRYRNQ